MTQSHSPPEHPIRPHAGPRYFLAGLLTVIPLWITWLILSFLFNLLSGIGNPVVRLLAKLSRPHFPGVGDLLDSTIFQSLLAFVLVVVLLYLLGWFTTIFVGRQLLTWFEAMVDRIPVVKKIYGASKQLMSLLQNKPGHEVQRVVLIDFPSPEMKAIGLVTRVITDSYSGRKLAAVYVPTTPNPTSGYLEIVPVERLISTNWTMEEAMSFIVSGGAVAPDSMPYERSDPPAPKG